MKKEILYKLWPKGFVDIKSIHYFENDKHEADENPENIAAYVTSYAVNLNTQFVDSEVAKIMQENKIQIVTTSSNKQIVKGARLLSTHDISDFIHVLLISKCLRFIKIYQ